MGMGYGSSLPMSGYYHQMGPMSQVIIMMCGDGSVVLVVMIKAEVGYNT